MSRADIVALQRRVGVKADGVIGPATIAAINAALDRGAPMPKRTKPANRRLADPSAFFSSARRLTGALSQGQVDTIEAMFDAADYWRASWMAYGLATAWHETGGKMVPNVESLNYSVEGLLRTFGRNRISEEDARRLGRKKGERALSEGRQRDIANIIYGGDWGLRNLGNKHPDDGWTYRGRGLDHCTGRRNYQRTGADINANLLAYPDALLDTATAVAALTTGMENGRYTGHTLARHLPGELATRAQFEAARQIINGTDKAAQIAGYAAIFQSALTSGGWR